MDIPLLHIELLAEDRMNIKIKGNPVIVCQMIATAMEARQDIAAAMIAAVVDYCMRNQIPVRDLDKMVKIH